MEIKKELEAAEISNALYKSVESKRKIKRDKEQAEQDKIKSVWDFLNKELNLEWIDA